jgi:hypothetical protein
MQLRATAMNMHLNRLTPSARVRLSSRAWRRDWIKPFLAWLSASAAACATYFRAAKRYEDLSRLSDAELERRGLGRKTLARHICESCERDSGK